MRARVWARSVAIVMTVAVAGFLSGGEGVSAAESGWPLDGQAAQLVAFGERYTTEDGSLFTHRGVDLAADPGAQVRAVLGGTVSFAGRVPAGEGATTIAVTVQSGDLRITVMPLAESSVRAGDTVVAGDALGLLAATGDRSHPSPHLHVGVRRGDLYIDPAPFLRPPPLPASGSPEARQAEAPVAVSEAAPVPQQTPVPVTASAVGAPAGVKSASTARAGAETPQVNPQGASGLVPSPSCEAAPVASAAAVNAEVRTPAAESAAPPVALSPDAGTAGEPVAAAPVAPEPFAAAARALDLDESRLASALTADRRPVVTPSSDPVGLSLLLGVAGVVSAVLLWPLWRSAPIPRPPVGPVREDVAAAVSR